MHWTPLFDLLFVNRCEGSSPGETRLAFDWLVVESKFLAPRNSLCCHPLASGLGNWHSYQISPNFKPLSCLEYTVLPPTNSWSNSDKIDIGKWRVQRVHLVLKIYCAEGTILMDPLGLRSVQNVEDDTNGYLIISISKLTRWIVYL